MHERALRRILLVQAIEETDQAGDVLPLSERTAATREVVGNNPPSVETQAEAPLSSATEWFLTRRADVLLRSLRTRSPGIDHVLALAGGATSLDRGTLVLAFVTGMILSLLDGGRGIDIFALPLVGLIAWNLLIYVVLLARRERGGRTPATTWFGSFYSRGVRNRIDGVARAFHAVQCAARPRPAALCRRLAGNRATAVRGASAPTVTPGCGAACCRARRGLLRARLCVAFGCRLDGQQSRRVAWGAFATVGVVWACFDFVGNTHSFRGRR